jgi:hypothetical protein
MGSGGGVPPTPTPGIGSHCPDDPEEIFRNIGSLEGKSLEKL